jgi:hypothetical protein
MSYRSDVQIVFYLTQGCSGDLTEANGNPHPMLTFPALKLWFEETYPIKEAKDEWSVEVEYGDDYILCIYTDVKWYSDFDHPNNVSTAFEKFSAAFRSDERDHRGQYEMVRIGENDDDINSDRSIYADCRIYVERSIIFE